MHHKKSAIICSAFMDKYWLKSTTSYTYDYFNNSNMMMDSERRCEVVGGECTYVNIEIYRITLVEENVKMNLWIMNNLFGFFFCCFHSYVCGKQVTPI